MIRVVVKLVLIFVLVYAGVTVWYGRLENALRQTTRPAATAVQRQPGRTTKILRQHPDYRIIIERNIFQAVIGAGPAGADEYLEPTALKLSLLGTVSGTKKDARAIIVDGQKKKQALYKIGDSVQGALIQSIERGKVILQVNGRREVLLLKDRQGGGRPDRRQLPPEPLMRSLRARLTGEERLVPRIQPRRRSSYRLPLPDRKKQGGMERALVPAKDDSVPPESRDDGPAIDSGGFSNE